jgi:hypothetical protein
MGNLSNRYFYQRFAQVGPSGSAMNTGSAFMGMTLVDIFGNTVKDDTNLFYGKIPTGSYTGSSFSLNYGAYAVQYGISWDGMGASRSASWQITTGSTSMWSSTYIPNWVSSSEWYTGSANTYVQFPSGSYTFQWGVA